MTSGITLSVRSELIEYGSLPTAPWKSQTDSLPSLHALIGDLLGAAARDATQAGAHDGGKGRPPGCVSSGPIVEVLTPLYPRAASGFVSLEELGAILDLNAPQTRVGSCACECGQGCDAEERGARLPVMRGC